MTSKSDKAKAPPPDVARGSISGPLWDRTRKLWLVRYTDIYGKRRTDTFREKEEAAERRAILDAAQPAFEVNLPELPKRFRADAKDAQKYSRDLARALWDATRKGDHSLVNLLGKTAKAASSVFELSFSARGYQEVVDELPEVEQWAEGIIGGRDKNAPKPEALQRVSSTLKSAKKRRATVHRPGGPVQN